jgi:hypothetical protein
MRTRLLFPAFWLLSCLLPMPVLRAQGRPLGPWRLTYRMVSTPTDSDDWGPAKLGKKVLSFVPTTVKWDVAPDSIRLFLNCENPLIAPAQQRKGQLPIRFTATGAKVRLDVQKRMLFVVPFDSAVFLSAYRGQTLLFNHEFRAVPSPLPILECWCNLSPAYNLVGEERYMCAIKATPTSEFAQALPDDALFRVSRGRVTLVRNGMPVHPAIPFDGPHADITALQKLALSGDQLKVDMDLVMRKNFRGDRELVPLTKQFTIAVP